MTDLKPCPFCGGEAVLSDGLAGVDGLSVLARNPRCRGCGCDLGYCSDAAAATKSWNTRVGPKGDDADFEWDRGNWRGAAAIREAEERSSVNGTGEKT